MQPDLQELTCRYWAMLAGRERERCACGASGAVDVDVDVDVDGLRPGGVDAPSAR